MTRLFLLSGAVAHDPAVAGWFGAEEGGLRSLARAWFDAIRACGPDVREILHDGCPTACVDDAAFAYVGAYRAHVNIGFFHGADLPDPAGLLEGTGKAMRHVKLRLERPVDADALHALIVAAYRNIKSFREG